jgi:polyphosphate kinase
MTDKNKYINRELSWLKFNERVLDEAIDTHHPLLERVKFLSIFSSNLDEFFMIRVSGLKRLFVTGSAELSIDGKTISSILLDIRKSVSRYLLKQSKCWADELQPLLEKKGIIIRHYHELSLEEQNYLRKHFEKEIFPVLTPLAFDPGHPFPFISNLSLNLAVVIDNGEDGDQFARVKVPDLYSRLVPVQLKSNQHEYILFTWLEELIISNLDMLFPGMKIKAAYPFRVTRDCDLTIDEDDADDLMETIEESVEMREFGTSVRLEVEKAMPKRYRDLLCKNLNIPQFLMFAKGSPIGMANLMTLLKIDKPELKDQTFIPVNVFNNDESIFNQIQRKDYLLYHPYDSFSPVVEFIRQAARDPQVLAIKQTLYRVGEKSPIVDALLEARDNGKQVAVLVELKARFDEENNIAWARKLEQNGVHVVYGLLGLKTHAKVCMVIRREDDVITRYIHLGTGNYNPITAKIYTDLSYFTINPEIGVDVTDLFNSLTGYSKKNIYKHLLVGPERLRTDIIDRIEREINHQKQYGNGHIVMKMNSLADQKCIDELYRASQAGVKINLQIRGICCLRPGVEGLSENITVTSIVGRFLEHARIYYFRNNDKPEIFLGSSDLMPRNLDRRVEVLFEITDDKMKTDIYNNIIMVHLNDNVQARTLLSDGSYRRIKHHNQNLYNSQEIQLAHWHRG